MLRVLFLSLRSDLGGGPEHLYQLLRNCPPDCEVFVGCPKDKPYYERFVSVLGANRITVVPHRAFSVLVVWELFKLIRTEEIAVIHSHGKGAGVYSRLLGLFTGRPVIHTFHGIHTGSYSLFQRILYFYFERFLGLFTNKVICVSNGEAEQVLSARLIKGCKVSVILNGVVAPEKIVRPKLRPGVLRIVAVNRFEFQKNPDLLLEIAAKLKAKLSFKMDVIGTGERFDEISQRIRSERLDDCISLHGGVEDPRSYFRNAHLFLSTSRWEGMPLAVLEAMSEGLCVFATNVVGNRDVITSGRNGILYETAEDAANMMYQLTPREFERYCSEARDDVNKLYSAKVMADRTFGVLRAGCSC